jgi:hypothetical protein
VWKTFADDHHSRMKATAEKITPRNDAKKRAPDEVLFRGQHGKKPAGTMPGISPE